MTAVITGIGSTPIYRASGRTVLDMALEAVRAAISDAGLEPGDVDGILSYQLADSVPVQYVAEALELPRVRWHNDISGGGTQCASILGDAQRAIDAGSAETVVVYRSLNGRTGKRLGQTALRVGADAEEQFLLPYGTRGPVHLFAMVAQRFLHERGYTEDDLAAVVLQSRANALPNQRATRREAMSLDDYRAAPYIATPLRLVDCCQENDGAAALVMTTARRAADSPHPQVRVRGVARAGGPGATNIARAADGTRIFSHYVAPLVYEAAGVTPADIDVALLYDAYSSLVLAQLEDFGFCERGQAGALVRAGEPGPAGAFLSIRTEVCSRRAPCTASTTCWRRCANCGDRPRPIRFPGLAWRS